MVRIAVVDQGRHIPCTHANAGTRSAAQTICQGIPHKYLNLNIVHGICANFETKGHFDVVGQSFLVALFDCSPLGAERLAFGVRKQSFQLGEFLQPGTRAQLEGLRNERAQLGIALD